MTRVFLDTNIILDILEKRESFYEAASNVFNLGMENKVKLFISALTYANCIYILRKSCGYEKALAGMAIVRKYVTISPMGEKELDFAIAVKSPDFEDMLQYYSALSVKCDILVTRNKKHFPKGNIPVMTADEFLQTL